MKTLYISIAGSICVTVAVGILTMSGAIDMSSLLHIKNTSYPHLLSLPILPRLGISINGTSSVDQFLQFDARPGQNITLLVNVTAEPKTLPIALSASPKLGFSKADGINWQLSSNQINNTSSTVLLHMSIGNNVRPAKYPMEIDANTQAISNVNFTEVDYFTLAVVSQNNGTVFSSLPAIHPQRCEYYPNTTICHGMNMEVDNQNRDYDESQVYDYLNRTVEMDNATFLYTGSSTPEKDNLNCDTEFPRAINVTFGHHPPIVVFDGYYKVNETRHFAVRLADGTTNSTTLCWSQFTKPKITEMCDTLCLPPLYTGMKITWLDENKTAGIVQHQYQTEDYYNAYIAEVKK